MLERDSERTEAEGLARKIAVAGLQVSQAADELQQAAERLMSAEEHAREAESRWRTADEQLAQGAMKNAELLEMLQSAREGQAEADERSRHAEQRLQTALDRARLMEAQMQEMEARVHDAETRPQVTVIVDDERTALQEAIAADVRRPLTSILGLTLALKHADPQGAEGKDMVRQLATNARKLDRLVGEILALDKIAAGAFTPSLRRTDLEALVHRVIEDWADAESRDLRIEAERVSISVDPALTEQMIETLLGNAGRRTAPGNPVWVKVSSDQGGVVIAVDDTGPEIPPGLRGAGPGDEGPAARQLPRGATGLTLLARLAEIHGGRAWVEERPGGGASFRVYLPDGHESHEAPVEEHAAARLDPMEARLALRKESLEQRAAARVRDVADERAIALAKALIQADMEEDDDDTDLFDTAAAATSSTPTTNGHGPKRNFASTKGGTRPSVKDIPGSLRL